jgi:hypothetical protein
LPYTIVAWGLAMIVDRNLSVVARAVLRTDAPA